jgi:hypothetical protein
MSKALQAPVQERYTAVQADETVTKPWKPRADGKVVLQLSERATVFVDPTPPMATPIEAADRVDPPVYGEVPNVWTWDLVHCRLLTVAEWTSRLPAPRRPASVRSFLGALQPQEPSRRSLPMTPAQGELFDWTWDCLSRHSEPDRAVLMGTMCGKELADVLAVLRGLKDRGAAGDQRVPATKQALLRRYRTLATGIALDWCELQHPIDPDTCRLWVDKAKKAIK